MRFTKLGRLAAAGAVITGLSLTATAAGAVDRTTSLQALKDAAHTATTTRIADLNKAITSVDGTAFLGADQSALMAGMQNDITGLKTLDTTIQADTAITAAKADAQRIFTDFRVYALVLPVTHLVVATDAMTNVVIPKMTTVADALQLIITKTNAASEQPTLDDMKAQIAGALTATNGLAADLQSFTPAQW